MLNLQLAEAFVDLKLERGQFNQGIALVVNDLNRLSRLGSIALRMDRSQATSSLNLLRQQLDELKRMAMINVRAEVGGGFGRGRGGSGGGGFGMGALQGLGVAGFAMNPQMMAGQMIATGLKDAVSEAMSLQSTFIDLQRVSGETAGNIEKFKGTIFEISTKQAGVSVKDLTDIATAGAKAGITDKEGLGGLETFTRGMAKVKNSVQGIGTETLTNDMTKMLNLFHKGTDYVEAFGSVLTRMDNISTSSAADILDISKSLSGTFTSLNLTIPQVMAFSSVLADVGLTNQQGASSFSQILRMMASQSEKFAEAIGMPVKKFQEAVKTDALGALKMLIDKFKEINEVDPIKAQEFISGLGFRGVKTAGALQQLASMIDDVSKRTAMANEEERTHGSLLAANAMNSEKAEGSVQKFKNAMLELATVIGEKFIPAVTTAAESATVAAKVALNKGGVAEAAHAEALRGVFGGGTAAEKEQHSAAATTFYQKLFGDDPEIKNKELATAAVARAKAAGGTDRDRQLAAVAADNATRQAAAEEARRTRFLPSDADVVAAQAEVGPAKEGAKGKVSDADQKEHDDAVFRHAQRLQAERQDAEARAAKAIPTGERTRDDQTVIAEDSARKLGEGIKRVAGMALGTLFAQGPEKAGIFAGLAEKAAGAVADAAGNPLKGAAKALKGVGPTEADIQAGLADRKKPFQSQKFTDPADFASHAIQTALGDKEDKTGEVVDQQKEANNHLKEIKEAIVKDKPNYKGGGMVRLNGRT